MLEETLSMRRLASVKATETIRSSDPNRIITEAAKWLAAHVESYIDNHETAYSLTFGDVDQEHFPTLYAIETSVLAAVPKDDDVLTSGKYEAEEVEMMKALTEKMAEATRIGVEHKEIFSYLFERLKFYYEPIVGMGVGGVVTKPIDGYIKLSMFEFDVDSMTVRVVKRMPTVEAGSDTVGTPRVESQIIEMNPSFIVDFTMVYWERNVETGLF